MIPRLLSRSEVVDALEQARFRAREARALVNRIPDFPHGLHKHKRWTHEEVSCFIATFGKIQRQGNGEG